MPPFLLTLLLKLSPVGRVLKAIPWQVWLALGVALALFIAVKVHGHKVEAFGRERYAAGERAAYARIEAKAHEIERKANALTGSITALLKGQNHETNRRIAAGYDALRVRGGPGQAICRDPGLAAASGGRVEAGGRPDAPVGRVSYPQWSELIAMPFGELIDRAERCDLNRAEVLTWREWHKRQSEAWARLQAEGSKP